MHVSAAGLVGRFSTTSATRILGTDFAWWMGGWTRKIQLLIPGSIAVATILSLVMHLLDGSMDGDLLYRAWKIVYWLTYTL